MDRQVTASCPGRVCLAGEDLDWTVGPSLLAAVGLRLTVNAAIADPVQGDYLVFETDRPFTQQAFIPFRDVGSYDGGVFDYARAAVKRLASIAGCTLPPITIRIKSDVPFSAGLSSSAAVIVATLGAMNELLQLGLSRAEICTLAFESEAFELSTGAGQMDFYPCVYGGVVYLDCSSAPPDPVEFHRLPEDLRLIVVDTKVRRSTKSAIHDKRERWAQSEPGIRKYVELTADAVAHLRRLFHEPELDVLALGAGLTACQDYLRDHLRVSTDLIDVCVTRCLHNGALGAKLTGTGLGGCMFALVEEAHVEPITTALRSDLVEVHQAFVDTDGLLVKRGSR